MLQPIAPILADKSRPQVSRPASVALRRVDFAHIAPPSAPKFGRSSASGWKSKISFEKYWDRFSRWRSWLATWLKSNWEQYYSRFKSMISEGLLVCAAVMGTMPFPPFVLDRLNRRFFFSPRKVSSKELLRSETLRKSMTQHIFYPNQNHMKELWGWYIKAQPGKPTVLFSHGRDCNISHMEPIMTTLKNKGYGVFLYDYPGFGKSEGKPSEKALYEAGLAASRYLAGDTFTASSCSVPYHEQIIMGHSLGGAVAVDVARKLSLEAQDKGKLPRALVLINTFTDIKAPFRERLERTPKLLRQLFSLDSIPFRFDSKNKIADVKMPVLILHGNKDETIHWRQGQALYEAAKKGSAAQYEFQEVRNARHNLSRDLCKTVADSLEKFLDPRKLWAV